MTERSSYVAADASEMPPFPASAEWASKQWGHLDLGDARLNRRALGMGTAMAAHPDWSLPRQMGNMTALQGAYDLLNHPRITLGKLSGPHWEHTRQTARERKVVLFVQDTTELDYTPHRCMKGLGPIGDGRGQGLLLHTTLAIVPEPTPEVLGVAHQQTLLRCPRPKPRPRYPDSPEGLVWFQAADAVGEPPEDVLWVHVGDGGADDFRFMAQCRGKHFLLRVGRNRLLAWDEEEEEIDPEMRKLKDYARQLPVQHRFTMEVPPGPKRVARTAQMCLSWSQVTIPPPRQVPEPWRHQPVITAWVVRSWEVDAPEGAEPLEWILLTSVPTETEEAALERTAWYACRWLAEDYHQCLKTGCQVEKSHLDDGEDIDRLLGFVGPIAAELLRLRQVARVDPDVPAVEHVDPLVVRMLSVKMEWSPTDTITMGRFWRGVAQLGGYLGRRRDGPPGWKTLWRGWQYLSDLVSGARLYAEHVQGEPPVSMIPNSPT